MKGLSIAGACLVAGCYAQHGGLMVAETVSAVADRHDASGNDWDVWADVVVVAKPFIEFHKQAVGNVGHELAAKAPPDLQVKIIVDGQEVCASTVISDSYKATFTTHRLSCTPMLLHASSVTRAIVVDRDFGSDDIVGECVATGIPRVRRRDGKVQAGTFACAGMLERFELTLRPAPAHGALASEAKGKPSL